MMLTYRCGSKAQKKEGGQVAAVMAPWPLLPGLRVPVIPHLECGLEQVTCFQQTECGKPDAVTPDIRL